MLKAIHRLKYDGRTALAPPLGKLLADALPMADALLDGRPMASAFDMVIPVPLHPSRLKTRGFNQAELLAREVCAGTGWPLATHNLIRVKKTPTQTAMTMDERAANVRGAFALRDQGQLLHKQVLIVDDVLTSTSTAREIARVIAEAGAARVCVSALARSA
jgi:ComF family protein